MAFPTPDEAGESLQAPPAKTAPQAGAPEKPKGLPTEPTHEPELSPRQRLVRGQL